MGHQIRIETVKYQVLDSMLLNEVQKQAGIIQPRPWTALSGENWRAAAALIQLGLRPQRFSPKGERT